MPGRQTFFMYTIKPKTVIPMYLDLIYKWQRRLNIDRDFPVAVGIYFPANIFCEASPMRHGVDTCEVGWRTLNVDHHYRVGCKVSSRHSLTKKKGKYGCPNRTYHSAVSTHRISVMYAVPYVIHAKTTATQGRVFTGVCLSVCLSVCLPSRYLINRCIKDHKNLTQTCSTMGSGNPSHLFQGQ